MKEFRNPQTIHGPVGLYSHQVEISANERILALSGQVGMRLDGTVPEDPFEQLEIAFENIIRNLAAAKMGVKDLFKLTYYAVGEMDTVKRRQVIASKLQEHKPCSTFIYVAALASPIYKIEIDAWAAHSD